MQIRQAVYGYKLNSQPNSSPSLNFIRRDPSSSGSLQSKLLYISPSWCISNLPYLPQFYFFTKSLYRHQTNFLSSLLFSIAMSSIFSTSSNLISFLPCFCNAHTLSSFLTEMLSFESKFFSSS